MEVINLHADRSQLAVVRSHELQWLPSPLAGVDRRPLERLGGEVALATSIVRYAPGSHFSRHRHDLGEEFLVLEGTFSDEHGDYPAGSYVRNPPGSEHSPFSRDGCLLFVKLRQMAAADRELVCVRPSGKSWPEGDLEPISRRPLWARADIRVDLERWSAGATGTIGSSGGGAEWLLLEGSLGATSDGLASHQSMTAGTWVRDPQAQLGALTSATGALLWVKRGHLPEEGGAPPIET